MSTDNKRSADATIKGYLAQALRTIELWLDLKADERLICEGLEDADVVNSAETLCHQFKELADSQSVYDLRGVIAHFAQTFVDAAEGKWVARFVFVTPAELFVGASKKAQAENLIRDWHGLDATTFETRVKALFDSWDPTPARHQNQKATFLAAAVRLDKLAGAWGMFQKSIIWQFDAPSFERVELDLVDRLRKDPRVGGLSELALSSLLHEVIRASSRDAKGERQLTPSHRDDLIGRVQQAARDDWTVGLLEGIERSKYEQELARSRRKIAKLLGKHAHVVKRRALLLELKPKLAQTKRLLVVGRRGVGKSLLVAELAESFPRAIWLDADDLGRTDKESDGELSHALRSQLSRDAGCLVVDGLEIADGKQLRELESLAEDCSGVSIIVTVRALSNVLNTNIALALDGSVQVDIPPLDDAELDALCAQEGAPLPPARSRPVLRAPFFFWLSRRLRRTDQQVALSSEREYLEAFWSQDNVTVDDEPCLIYLAKFFLDQRQREHLFAPEHAGAVARLVRAGILAYSGTNEYVVSFQHDVFLDYAVARHVLQRMFPPALLIAWLREVDVVVRSWALPSIEFEAERHFVHDKTSYWDIACLIVDVEAIVDWLAPARAATPDDVAQLITRIQAGDRAAADVFQRLEHRAAS
ncbi:MAG: hypothetical protein HYS27_22825 [Deltaproteobacteria bacterium]|nr:hypothetical protein [Deltaproteobacteria bacterium]